MARIRKTEKLGNRETSEWLAGHPAIRGKLIGSRTVFLDVPLGALLPP